MDIAVEGVLKERGISQGTAKSIYCHEVNLDKLYQAACRYCHVKEIAKGRLGSHSRDIYFFYLAERETAALNREMGLKAGESHYRRLHIRM
jgi:hypothetical protein